MKLSYHFIYKQVRELRYQSSASCYSLQVKMVRTPLMIVGVMMVAFTTSVQCEKIDSLLRANQRVVELLSRLNEHVANSRARALVDRPLTGGYIHMVDIHGGRGTPIGHNHKPSLRWLIINKLNKWQ
ncbi:uncharacterized protein LOC134796055 [Cydia splendana]|uniref:uncharacterized protein LOC134796055 n=1 Tax=Cydia splendana TaxID=1100963 RepID=UPI0028F4C4A1